MRRQIVTALVAVALLLGAFGATVLALNSTLYSPSGFVQGYLEALARHDADGALELAGASTLDGSDSLLQPDAMGSLTGIRHLSTSNSGAVTFAYEANGVPGESTFSLIRAGSTFGLFTTWAFERSPLGVIQLSVMRERTFTANGIDLDVPAPNQPTPFLVFTPSTHTLAHESSYLEARPMNVSATQPGGSVLAALDIRPNASLIAEVQRQVNEFLDNTCVPQAVLLPAGCPFGQQISNRTTTAPAWSIATYPPVTLSPGPSTTDWLMPPTDAAAHLTVGVQSLFDGSITTFDEDVPFTVSFLVTLPPGGQVQVEPRQ